MADELKIESPAWWLHLLLGRLLMDQPRMVLMDRYYRGQHPLPYVPRELTVEFRTMLARSKSNFMRLPVEAPAQRLHVQGFRAPGTEKADADAWARWAASGMIGRSGLSIIDSLAMGRSYLSVWKPEGQDRARIEVEDPRGTIVAYDRKDRRKRAAGLRVWVDDWTGKIRADVWLPQDACYSFLADKSAVIRSSAWPQPWQPAYPIQSAEVARVDMELREEPVDIGVWTKQWTEMEGPVPNPGEVPLVELVNRPSVSKWPDGESQIADVIASQDRINEQLFNLHLAAWTTAYRQKWATGLDIPTDGAGNPVQPYKSAIDRLWVSEDENTKFGEFGATDLAPYIDSIEQAVQHIAVQTQVPRHYFQQQGQDPSGDALKSAEAGLTAMVRGDKQPTIGAAFAEAQHLAAVMEGTDQSPLEVVWSDPENRTMAETTDAVIKQFAAGLISRRAAQEKLGYSPTEMARMEADLAQQDLVAEARAMVVAPPEPAAVEG